jgi:hypothetical protein
MGSRFCDKCGMAVKGEPTSQARFTSAETYTPQHLAEKILTSRSAVESERKQITATTWSEPMRPEDGDAFWRVNALKVFLGVAFIILATRSTAYLSPYGGYFSWSALLFGDPSLKWYAIVIKYAIPVIVGFLIGFVEKENPEGTAASAGFLSAFIMTWPALIAWNRFAPPEFLDRQRAFALIWLLYFVSFAYFALVGARVNRICLKWQSAEAAGKKLTAFGSDLLSGETLKNLLVAVVTSVLSELAKQTFFK